jgi:hypothetical protein
MSAHWAKPGRGRHIFVLLRHDEFVDDPIESITGTKAYDSEERAQSEADRLNAINGDKRARYFVRLARLQDAEDGT